MTEMDKLLPEINALARKSKEEGLTDDEKARQQVLRARYLELYRHGFQQHLENIRVVDPKGRDITPRKMKS